MGQPKASRIAQRRSNALSEGGADYSAKRSELIRVAADVFRAKGYAAATLNDIAAEMGVDRASLYYYVASKEELFQEAITALVLGNIAKAALISAEDIGPRQKIEKLVALVITSHVEHYPYMYVYIQEDMRRVREQDAAWAVEMVAATHRLEHYFMAAIDEGVSTGEFRSDQSTTLVANALFGMMLWTHRWFVPGHKYEAQDLIDTFTTIFFAGFLAGAEPRYFAADK